MTATQAPTPGPLSVGNLHTAIMEALAEDIQRQRPDALREEDENGFEGDVIIPTGATPQSAFAKVNVSDLAEVILPLVAPTAPVEASGSERALVYLIEGDEDAVRLKIGGIDVCAHPQDTPEGMALLKFDAALHPQPSGETREAVARVIDPWPFGVVANIQHTERAATDRDNALAKADEILALLSARPLALGGQQGEDGEVRSALRSLLHYCKNGASNTRLLKAAMERAETALSTTPARAEAQDEGAAGEPWGWAVTWIERPGLGLTCEVQMGAGHQKWAQDRAENERGRPGIYEPKAFALYAHPSPTPAADADRVREAIIQAVSKGLDNEWKDWEITNAILTALKSTAAKEGGAG